MIWQKLPFVARACVPGYSSRGRNPSTTKHIHLRLPAGDFPADIHRNKHSAWTNSSMQFLCSIGPKST